MTVEDGKGPEYVQAVLEMARLLMGEPVTDEGLKLVCDMKPLVGDVLCQITRVVALKHFSQDGLTPQQIGQAVTKSVILMKNALNEIDYAFNGLHGFSPISGSSQRPNGQTAI